MAGLPGPEKSSILPADDALASPCGLLKFGLYLLHLSTRFARDVHGGLMVSFAFVFPVMLLGVGAAIDYGQLYSKRTTLQAAADNAALTGASELKLANRAISEIEEVAKASAMANLQGMPGTVRFSIKVSQKPAAVTVALSQTPGMYFMDTLLGTRDTVLKVRATARIAGETPICMLILDKNQNAALKVNNGARITGNECAVYSNSVSSTGITAKKSGILAAELICSAGGADGGSDSFKPGVLTDCPTMDDPLARRTAPTVGRCIAKGMKLGRGNWTLRPGTYCGGLSIGGSANVTLRPGVYVMLGGPLSISGKAIVRGKYVGFYLTGRNATFSMGPNTTIEFYAPKDGDMTGILFFEDRNASSAQKHTIRSNAARSLVGTFYLPRGSLTIDATKPLFDKSAYTIIIARELDMFSGPDLILNSDYDNSDIPIPDEMDEATSPGEQVMLVK
jgi:Flp pilus assembly protein TadG